MTSMLYGLQTHLYRLLSITFIPEMNRLFHRLDHLEIYQRWRKFPFALGA